MLTKDQQDHMDGVFARVGKPSPALQFKIDQLRAALTEGEVITVLMKDADVVRSKDETELLCLVAMTRQLEIKERHKAAIHEELEWVEKVKMERPPASLREYPEPQSKQNGFFNLVKAIGIVVLLFFGGVALLSAIFDKKDTSPKIEYTIVTTTINGQFYEKEATAEDLNSEFVTFADGTRVPWSAVKSTKSTISVNELSNALNVINAPPAKQ
jgi:hypothetical protein